MAEVKTYKANADGWVAGRRVKKDEPLKLTERQARYENVRPAKATTVTETPKDKAK